MDLMFGPGSPSKGDIHYPSGNHYTGELRGKKRWGQGTLTWADGSTYVGDWLNDQMHGSGSMRFPNGSVFSGQFVNGNPSGHGALQTINAEVLDGNWVYHGRAQNVYHGSAGPVGTYLFHGVVTDGSGARQRYTGPATLHLLTGLVALPDMDPMAPVLPVAMAMPVHDDAESKKLAAEPLVSAQDQQARPRFAPQANVPQADVVPNSVAYGYRDPALRPRDDEDRGQVDMMDPRAWIWCLCWPLLEWFPTSCYAWLLPPNARAREQGEVARQNAQAREELQRVAGADRV